MAPKQHAISSSSAWLKGVVQVFESQGVDVRQLFADCGVEYARLSQPHTRFSVDEVAKLWSLAVERSGQPALGMDRQLALRWINYDFAAQAMWPSRTLRGGVESLSRYLHLTQDSSAFDVEPDKGGAWLRLAHLNDGKTPRQRPEFGLLTLLTLCRKVTHRQFRPLAVEFLGGEPVDYHPYRMAFACPLRFGQKSNRLFFADEDLDRPLAAAASLFAVQEQVLEERLARIGHLRFSYRASEEIIRRIHLGEPRLAAVAASMSLSEGSLERRLKAEGTSFERLLEESRRELAQHYLGDAAYPMTRLPSMLGYASWQPFGEAAKRWFGMPPAAYRQMLQADGQAQTL